MCALPAWNPFALGVLRFVPNMFEEAGGPARARRAAVAAFAVAVMWWVAVRVP